MNISTTTRRIPADLRTRLGKADNWITETRTILRGTITSTTRGTRTTPDTITIDGVDTFDVGREGLIAVATDPSAMALTGGSESRLVGLVAEVHLTDQGHGDQIVIALDLFPSN